MMKASHLDKALDSMIVFVDTRETNLHVRDDFEKRDIFCERKKLDFGDYSFYIPANEDLGILEDINFEKMISIERKANLNEICTNLTAARDRFKREMVRSNGNMIILIENATYEDIVKHRYRSKMSPNSLLGSLHGFQAKYGIPFTLMK